MENLKEYEDLLMIDQLDEGIDWFTLVSESNREIAKRIKATPTVCLRQINDGSVVCESFATVPIQRELAKKELAFRLVNESKHENGDPRYSAEIAGYDKFDKTIHEKLSSDDPVEKWIADFIKSDNPNFDGKSKKERINMALGAYYAATKKTESIQERRDFRIVTLATKEVKDDLIRYFVEANTDIADKSVLEIKDLYEEFIFDLIEAAISVGAEGSVKCVKPWGACTVGKVYKGVWKQAARATELRLDLDASLPRATAHPIIFFDKKTNNLSIPKQFELL